MADTALEIILTYATTGVVQNCVNLAERTPATHLLVVRHRDEVGVLAGVLDLLREASINVEQMENIIFRRTGDPDLPRAACARIQVVGEPPTAILRLLGDRSNIFDVKLVRLEAP